MPKRTLMIAENTEQIIKPICNYCYIMRPNQLFCLYIMIENVSWKKKLYYLLKKVKKLANKN